MFSILGLIFTSCEPSVTADGEYNGSVPTFLPLITLEGGDVLLECDVTSYSDPGAVASAGGVELDLTTDIVGTYFGGSEVNGPDIYSVSYSAYNDDEIPATNFREVVWPPCSGDLITSIAGTYNVTSLVRTPGYSTADVGPILIIDMGGGMYGISDAIGGWYEHEYGYGPDYAAKGLTIVANDIAANDFTLNNTTATLPWGPTQSFTDFSVDAGAGTISVTCEWPEFGYVWEYTLEQM